MAENQDLPQAFRRVPPVVGLTLLLAALTLISFWPVLQNGFIKFDDQQYLLENPHLVGGLTWRNVVWAFGSGYASNWHPLTWISHMLDVQLFGLRPAGHHLVSLLIHTANVILLFRLLVLLTGASWRSAFAAALFAVHPLHVESVAWAAERKDVLSTLFLFLTIWAYAVYARGQAGWPWPVQSPGAGDTSNAVQARRLWGSLPYVCALLLFALGLLCKPMLVTLPGILLLVDFWPLQRLEPTPSQPRASRLSLLLQEKVPFVFLSLTSCIVTYLVQQHAHATSQGLPFSVRLANAATSYWRYLGKTLWPTGLAIFYPHPATAYLSSAGPARLPISVRWPVGPVVLASLGLAVVSMLVLTERRRAPWWTTGWFWYLGALVPVLGLVQVGTQAMADRYSYVPLIGVFIALSWSAAGCAARLRSATVPLAAAAAIAVGICSVLTYHQVEYWRDNLTLFQHALQVTTRNAVAEANVGASLAEQGRLDLAEPHLRAAVTDDPQYPEGHLYLGIALALRGHLDAAVAEYEATLKLQPWHEIARFHLARTLQLGGAPADAAVQYQELLRQNPKNAEASFQLGTIRFSQGDLVSAAGHFEQAIQVKPDYTDALIELGRVEAGLGQFAQAQASFRRASALSPTNANLHLNLGNALMLAGQTNEARASFAKALLLDPELPGKFLREGKAAAARASFNVALARFKTAWWLKPADPEIEQSLAWILATHPLAPARDGRLAVQLAQAALAGDGQQHPEAWAALDAAYAETGRFHDAMEAAQKCHDLAQATGDSALAQAAESRLQLYRQNQPYHQQPQTP